MTCRHRPPRPPRLARARQARRADRADRRRRRGCCPSPLFRANRIVPGEARIALRRAAAAGRRRCCSASCCWSASSSRCCALPPRLKLLTGFVGAGGAVRRRSAAPRSYLTPDGRHLRPRLARRRLLAAGLCLRAAGRRRADAAAASRRWSRIGVLVARRRRRSALLLLSRRLERSVDPQGIRQPRRQPSGARRATHWRWPRLAGRRDRRRRAARHPLPSRAERLRAGVLNVLNIVQTIPSIALFGLLIAPLGLGRRQRAGRRGASAFRGIGAAPALRGAVPLFAAAGGGQHRGRPRRRAARRRTMRRAAWA